MKNIPSIEEIVDYAIINIDFEMHRFQFRDYIIENLKRRDHMIASSIHDKMMIYIDNMFSPKSVSKSKPEGVEL